MPEELLWFSAGVLNLIAVLLFKKWLQIRRNRRGKRNLYRKSENPPVLETPHRVRTAQSATAKPVRTSRARFKARRRFK